MSGALSEEDIRARLGAPNAGALNLRKPALSPQMKAFIGRAPVLFLGTQDEDGFPLVTPRGDAPGFVRVVDDTTLLLPERKGNAIAGALRSIARDGKVGVTFLVPGSLEVLRLTGTAEVLDDPALCAELAAREGEALLVIRVTVRTAWFHCGKAMLRSRLWRPDEWPEPVKVSLGAELQAYLAEAGIGAADVDAHMANSYAALSEKL